MPKKTVKAPTGLRSPVVRPKAPPPGIAKIHLDAGMSRAHIRGSAEAVRRDAEGNYMAGSSLVVHDVATLEAIACREALSLVEDLVLQNFIIASDSEQIVNDIDRGSHGRYGAIIVEIKQRATMFNCKFTFEGRAANSEAVNLHVRLVQPHDPFRIALHMNFEQ